MRGYAPEAKYILDDLPETMKRQPSNYAMERAAEEIGPGILKSFNQKQLAVAIDRALSPIISTFLFELRKIDADERFHYPCANIVINAPLALIQLEMETRVRLLQSTLALTHYEGPEMDIKPGPTSAALKP